MPNTNEPKDGDFASYLEGFASRKNGIGLELNADRGSARPPERKPGRQTIQHVLAEGQEPTTEFHSLSLTTTPSPTLMHISGKCHCGAISFTATVDPHRVLVCHCADCQVFSGAPFRAVLPTPAESVEISGTAKHYVKVAESGNKRVQAFCPECGTQLYATEGEGPPKVLNLRLGCVDQRDQLAPAAQIWGNSAMPWLEGLPSVPMHHKGLASPIVQPQP